MAEKQGSAPSGYDNFKSLQELAKEYRPKFGNCGNAPVELEKREMNEEQLRRIAEARTLILEAFRIKGVRRRKRAYNRLCEMRMYTSQITDISNDLPQILISILEEFQNGIKQPQYSIDFIHYLSCSDLTEKDEGEAERSKRTTEALVDKMWSRANPDQRGLLEILQQSITRPRSQWEDDYIQRKIRDMKSINMAQVHAIATWLEVFDELYESDWAEDRRQIQDAVRYWKNKEAS